MGPCQGAFCTFRVAGLIAERLATSSPAADPATDPVAVGAAGADVTDRALIGFLRERFKGTRPIAHGRQLQELLLAHGIHVGVLGVDALPPVPTPTAAADAAAEARDGSR